MINVQSLFHSFCEYAKDYKAGPDPVPEWNSKLQEAQLELMDAVAPLYDLNERIRTLMRPFIKPHNGVTDTLGFVAVPGDLYRMIGSINATYNSNTFPVKFSYESGVVINSRIPQRAPSLAKRIAYFHYTEGGIQLYPRQAFTVSFHYIAKPASAAIAYKRMINPATDEHVIELDTDNTVDLEWNDDAYNLLLFILLEKYGLVTKDQLLIEYGKLGVNSDLIRLK